MSAEAKMLERHGWRQHGPATERGAHTGWWLDPKTDQFNEQWRAVLIQRTRNREAREAKREAQA